MHRAPYAVAAIVLLLFVLAIGLYRSYATHFYTEALRDAAIHDQVTWRGETYHIVGAQVTKDGVSIESVPQRIYTLAYEKQLARRSPLLSLAHVDLDTLDAAIQALEDTDIHLQEIQTSDDDRRAVEHLFPIDFLRALSNTEDARRAFLENGDEASARAYATRVRETLRTYANELRDFRHAFVAAIPTTARAYADNTYTIDRTSILGALDALLRHNDSILRTNITRTWCVRGLPFMCDTNDIALALDGYVRSAAVPEGALSRARDVREILSTAKDGAGEFGDTFIALSSSDCAARPDVPLYVMLTEPSPWSSRSFIHPLYAGDIRFQSPLSARQTAFGRHLVSSGMRYLYSPTTTHYSCFTWGEELSRMWTVQAIAEFAQDEQLSNVASSADATQELSALEQKLNHGADIIHESDAVAYLWHASRLDPAKLSSSTVHRLEDVLLMWRGSTGAFDSLVHNIAKAEKINACLVDDGVPIALDKRYLFLVRSAFSSLFLLHQAAEMQELFKTHDTPLREQPYELYSALEENADTGLRARQDLNAYFAMHIESLEKCGLRN